MTLTGEQELLEALEAERRVTKALRAELKEAKEEIERLKRGEKQAGEAILRLFEGRLKAALRLF